MVGKLGRADNFGHRAMAWLVDLEKHQTTNHNKSKSQSLKCPKPRMHTASSGHFETLLFPCLFDACDLCFGAFSYRGVRGRPSTACRIATCCSKFVSISTV